jgi:hypothetical protein
MSTSHTASAHVKAHVKALTARRDNKEIISDYTLDFNPVSGYYSASSYEFDFR